MASLTLTAGPHRRTAILPRYFSLQLRAASSRVPRCNSARGRTERIEWWQGALERVVNRFASCF